MPESFETFLDGAIDLERGDTVSRAMKYSLMAGGKRIRPFLMLALLEDYGIDPKPYYPAAAAIEMIHTYSLIHDDLPAMDNDDLRRGKPTCHKAFDEATAILAGDGLLTEAFVRLASLDADPAIISRLVKLYGKSAGYKGMIYGQALDLQAEKEPGKISLDDIETYKTGKLLALPLQAAAIIAQNPADEPLLEEIGLELGVLFQIQDDILEQTVSVEQMGKSFSDNDNNKSTAVTALGLQGAIDKVETMKEDIRARLSKLSIKPEHLSTRIEQLFERKH